MLIHRSYPWFQSVISSVRECCVVEFMAHEHASSMWVRLGCRDMRRMCFQDSLARKIENAHELM